MNINISIPKINFTNLRNNTLDGLIKICDKAKSKPPTDDELTAIIEEANLNDEQKLVVLNFLQRELKC